MGGWKLEGIYLLNFIRKFYQWSIFFYLKQVFRMTSYVALPIVCFYLFNKPEYFKEELASTKQYYLIREDQQGVCFILTYFIIL